MTGDVAGDGQKVYGGVFLWARLVVSDVLGSGGTGQRGMRRKRPKRFRVDGRLEDEVGHVCYRGTQGLVNSKC